LTCGHAGIGKGSQTINVQVDLGAGPGSIKSVDHGRPALTAGSDRIVRTAGRPAVTEGSGLLSEEGQGGSKHHSPCRTALSRTTHDPQDSL